jgi:hypothetical protein
MHVTSKTRGFGILFYSIAALSVALGIALSFSGSARAGTLLIVLSIPVACGTALKLGHLKPWY